MVSNNFPDKPSRRDSLGRGLSIVDCSSLPDTITTLEIMPFDNALCTALGQMTVYNV